MGLAILPLLLGDPFLLTYGVTVGEHHLSTTLGFEFGIFLVLAGGTLDLFRSIGLQDDEEVP